MGQLDWSIGAARITRFVEMEAALDAQGFFPASTPEALARHRSWLEPSFMDREGRLLLSIHALLVEIGGIRILIDTCIGEHRVPGMEALGDRAGDFLDQMARAGAPRESIDVVLCTHLHFDHIGWNTMRDGTRWVPTFPNARYLFAKTEWDHWSVAPPAPLTTNLDAVQPVLDAGLADLVACDHVVCDGVRLEPTPGHTPGHVSVRIASGGADGLVTGDAAHHPVQFAETDWGISADVDAAGAAATRRRLVRELANTETLVIGTHFAGPTAGRVVRTAAGVRFVARR
jgi:glyoxylase-like metal-dependent hydrolase (beta-lactamase superfamily II)